MLTRKHGKKGIRVSERPGVGQVGQRSYCLLAILKRPDRHGIEARLSESVKRLPGQPEATAHNVFSAGHERRMVESGFSERVQTASRYAFEQDVGVQIGCRSSVLRLLYNLSARVQNERLPESRPARLVCACSL